MWKIPQRAGSTRLIVLLAVAAASAGAFYFVGTGADESGDEPARPAKRVQRTSIAKSVADEESNTAESRVTSVSTIAVELTPEPTVAQQPVRPADSTENPGTPTQPLALASPAVAPVALTEPDQRMLPARVSPVVPVKIIRYAEQWLRKRDLDGSGRLEAAELAGATLLREADRDRDGTVSIDELTDFAAGYGRSRRLRLLPDAGTNATGLAAEAGGNGKAIVDETAATRRDRRYFVTPKRLPPGLPDWFVERDGDGDAQLTPAEFSPTSVRAELDEFTKFDLNGDGLLTADEYVQAAASKPTAEKSAEARSGPASASP